MVIQNHVRVVAVHIGWLKLEREAPPDIARVMSELNRRRAVEHDFWVEMVMDC